MYQSKKELYRIAAESICMDQSLVYAVKKYVETEFILVV